MIHILDYFLSPHITDKIFKYIKKDFQIKLKYILENNTVFILHKSKISFLILEKYQNFYQPLKQK